MKMPTVVYASPVVSLHAHNKRGEILPAVLNAHSLDGPLNAKLVDFVFFFLTRKKCGTVFSWLIGEKKRKQQELDAARSNNNNSTQTAYTPDSSNLLNSSNPNSMNLIDPEPEADLNL